jgi:methionine-S-sulfoxide reductase
LLKLYFETHNFTQIGGQGPDIGEQYRSVIFYTDNQQKAIAEKLIKHLEEKNYKVATKLEKATQFYPAEEYHQDYYFKRGGSPYCHIKKKVF